MFILKFIFSIPNNIKIFYFNLNNIIFFVINTLSNSLKHIYSI